MSAEDELLARELGKVGAQGVQIAGKILQNPALSAAGSLAGFFGPDLAARYLPTERFQMELTLRADLRTVLTKSCSLLADKGRIVDSDQLRTSPYPTVSGVLGSGFLNMNPVVVYVEVVQSDENACKVIVTGAAKEGLIKQSSAKKAVCRLAEELKTLA
ncbi:MAG: hypothetical protein JXB10_11795 [Pirellulales bacterium]|nr:hypothetical protein [Pirellulales bacterium]